MSASDSLTMVALSGGVDSSTTAWLLKQRGERVAAMFMKNWEEDDPDAGCSAEDDAEDARSVAELLGIDFHARNFATEYWESVFEQFLGELEAGRTPNPDILCNREIKFKAFVDHARDLGADRIATGHYARRRVEPDGSVALLKGVDPGKDQSYFLHALTQEQLACARFPLGEMDKVQVRQMASDAGLPVAEKKDSTGICFIGERNFDRFIARHLSAEAGDIVDPDGRVIGRHRGLIHYTLGQRRGLNIGGLKNYPERPWFAAFKDMQTNRLWAVQDSHHPLLMSTRLSATQLNWIGGEAPAVGSRLTAKVRYRQPDQDCTVVAYDAETLVIEFERPQRAVTPGQSVVVYDGDRCLGGGVIKNSNAPRPDAAVEATNPLDEIETATT